MIRDSKEFCKKASMYHQWREKYIEYNNKILEIEYEESKIPSMFPDTVMIKTKLIAVPKSHGDPHNKIIKRLEMIDQKHELEIIRDDYKKKCTEIEEALFRLPESFRMTVIAIYIDRSKTIVQLSKELGYSSSGISNKIYRMLDHYLGESHI